MSHHISPQSVSTYLSGLVSQLEPFFPHIREARHSRLVKQTLKGCLKLRSKPTICKHALSRANITMILQHHALSTNYDDLLFVAMFITGFFALLRLSELTFPDDASIRNWHKVVRHSFLCLHTDQYEFILPAHKADWYFEGNRVIVWGEQFQCPTLPTFSLYLSARDKKFPLASPLWLTSKGVVPTLSFFMTRLQTFFPTDIAGQSL